MTVQYEGPDHLSVSQVHAIQDCSWHWFLERVARVPRRPAWALVGGKAFHAATEELDHMGLGGTWITDFDLLKQLWAEHFAKAIEEELEHADKAFQDPSEWRASGRATKANPNKEDRAWWNENGPSMLANWVSWRLNNPAWEIAEIGGKPAIEAEISGPIGTSMPLLGYIDRVFYNPATRAHMVLDLKTGAHIPRDTMQLGTYSLFLELLFGIRPQWGCYWMARTGVTTPPVDLTREWPAERLIHDLKGAEAVVRSNSLGCSVGQYCPTSAVAGDCYACTGIGPETILPWEVEVAMPTPLVSNPVLTYGGENNSTTTERKSHE